MDIYAQAGHKVICTDTSDLIAGFGNCTRAEGILVVGEQYTVKHTEVHTMHTKVYLEEVEGAFNSSHFEDVVDEGA